MNIVVGKFKLEFSRFNYVVFYLGLIHILTFINIFRAGAQFNTLVIDVVAIYSVTFATIYIAKRLYNPEIRPSLLDVAVLLFILYSILSIFFYLQPSNPASITAYFYGLHLLILPSFLYFTVAKFDACAQEKLLRFICSLHVVLVIIGMVLFFLRPDFYTDYLRERLATRNAEEIWQLYSRLHSYMGSSATGMLSAITIAILPIVKFKQLTKYILLLLLLFAVLLTQQRGAYVSAFIAMLFFLFYKNYNLKYLLLVVIISTAGIVLVSLSSDDVVGYVFNYTINRISGDMIGGDPYSERAVSYIKGLDFWSQFPFGMGVGATTSAADSAGAHPGGQVADANYIRILCDLGLFGLYLFLAVIIISVYAVYKNNKSKYFLVILFIYCFQATGTNVFDIFYVNHLFWIFLGIINADSNE